MSAQAVEEAWTTHDIRRSVATRMADLGIMPHVIEQILNHQVRAQARTGGRLQSKLIRARGAQPRWQRGTITFTR